MIKENRESVVVKEAKKLLAIDCIWRQMGEDNEATP